MLSDLSRTGEADIKMWSARTAVEANIGGWNANIGFTETLRYHCNTRKNNLGYAYSVRHRRTTWYVQTLRHIYRSRFIALGVSEDPAGRDYLASSVHYGKAVR